MPDCPFPNDTCPILELRSPIDSPPLKLLCLNFISMSIKFQHEFFFFNMLCALYQLCTPHWRETYKATGVACVHLSMKSRSCVCFVHCYSPRFCYLYDFDTHIPMTCIQSHCSLPHHETQQMNCCLTFCRICAVKWGSKICPHHASFPPVGGLDKSFN